MKKKITLFAFISIAILNFAQLNNTSFENWENPLLHKTVSVTGTIGTVTFYVCDDFDYNELENWSSTNQLTKGSNLGNVELVTESPNATVGTKSVKIESKEIDLYAYLDPNCILASPLNPVSNPAPGLIVNGSFDLDIQDLVNGLISGSGLASLNPFLYPGVGEAINFIPKTISGYYQYTGGVSGTDIDSCIIVSGLKKNGKLIGYVTQRFGNNASLTPFSINYEHLTCETPDSIVTVISSSNIDLEIVNGEFVINSNFTGIDSSVLYIDGLHLDTILPSEFPPLLLDDSAIIFTNETAIEAVQTNDLFCDNTPTTPSLMYIGTEGMATVNANNEIEFTPATGFDGEVVIPYYNCNGIPLCDTAYFYVTVLPIVLCDATDDSYTLSMGSTTTNNPKLNDLDCGTSITIITPPTQGVADLDFAGNINYSPNTSFSGSDSLKYSICSSITPSQCDTATVRYTITPVGINELDNNLIDFYPNPAKNTLHIAVEVSSEINVTIYNTLGKVVITSTFNHSNSIDISQTNNGLYFVEIESNGKRTIKKLQIVK